MAHTFPDRQGCSTALRSLGAPGLVMVAALLATGGCGGSPHEQRTAAEDTADTPTQTATQETAMTQSVHDFTLARLAGEEESLSAYEGQVLLIVNTASKCGLTPQYEGLQKLHEEYGERGLAVLGFPCNQFGKQEPGTSEEIASFCTVNYGVTFPMFAKIDVNGENTHPLYVFLRGELPGEGETSDIEWNFGKFLIDAEGRPVKRFNPKTTPEEVRADIETLLASR